MSNDFGMGGKLDAYLAPVFPAGEYRFQIMKCEVKNQTAGPGKTVMFFVHVMDGPCLGKKHTFYCDTDKPRGQQDIAKVTQAVGFPEVKNAVDYAGKTFVGQVIHNDFNGKTYANLGECKKDTGPSPEQAATSEPAGEIRNPF